MKHLPAILVLIPAVIAAAAAPPPSDLPPPVSCARSQCSDAGGTVYRLIDTYHAMTRSAEAVRAVDPASANAMLRDAGVCLTAAEAIYQAADPSTAAAASVAQCDQALADAHKVLAASEARPATAPSPRH